jgi:hypothetical protein
MPKPCCSVAFESIKNQLATYKQRERPVSGFVAAVVEGVCVGNCVKFCTLTCTPPPLPDVRPITNKNIFRVRSMVGQVLDSFENEGGDVCCTINFYIKQDQVPRCVSLPGNSTVPLRIVLTTDN